MRKPGLYICTQNTPIHITVHISISYMKFPVYKKIYKINSVNCIRLVIDLELFKFEIKKCSQILCTHIYDAVPWLNEATS